VERNSYPIRGRSGQASPQQAFACDDCYDRHGLSLMVLFQLLHPFPRNKQADLLGIACCLGDPSNRILSEVLESSREAFWQSCCKYDSGNGISGPPPVLPIVDSHRAGAGFVRVPAWGARRVLGRTGWSVAW